MTMSCHLITPILLGTPCFVKLYKRAHISLSVNFVLIQPMHIFKGSSLYKFGKQNSIMLNCEKTLSVIINHLKGEIENASSPSCGFWRIDDRQLES
jgi:hypothetical protein